VYYLGDCNRSSHDAVPFPFTNVQTPSKGRIGLAAVQEIFKNDKNVTVREEAGIIRVWIGKVPTAILQTKLRFLTLDPIAQYNPSEAIIAMLNTREMQAAMRSLQLSPPLLSAGSRTLPDKELPHLPESVKDVTVDQLLDLIAKTWDGPVIYGVCAAPMEADGETRFVINAAQDVMPKGAWREMGIERPD
jgi:hypothetical protein